jgi:pimeloyl-ACP methyl ester carboxylesterase
MTTDAVRPEWYRRSLAETPESLRVNVEGASVEVLAWGRRGNPGLLFLHGQSAHAGWWRHIAPWFSAEYRVAALSWSGMGRSDWRPRYSFDLFVAEILAAIDVAGLNEAAERPLVVGHSFGAIPMFVAASRHGAALAGAVSVDCYVRPPEAPFRNQVLTDRSRLVYPDREALLSRFRLAPPQPAEPYIVADIAAEAVAEVGNGVAWCADHNIRAHMERVAIAPYMATPACPIALMAGAKSGLVDLDVRRHVRDLAPPNTPYVEIPEADHHVMLDQPLAFVACLRGLLAAWPPPPGVPEAPLPTRSHSTELWP